jgi:hypothetical protein
VLEPEEGAWWAIRPALAHRIFPSGAVLFEERGRFDTVAARARRIAYEREGRRVVLERSGATNWRITQPPVPLEIFRPAPIPEDPRPLSMAEEYVERLKTIVLDEVFVPDTSERKALVEGAFNDPWGRVAMDGRDGERTEILISHPVAETGRVFVSVNGKVGVVVVRSGQSLAPELGQFFDANDFARARVEWP